MNFDSPELIHMTVTEAGKRSKESIEPRQNTHAMMNLFWPAKLQMILEKWEKCDDESN